jgi:hypothetical protein
MTQPDNGQDQQAAVDRMTMDYPVTLDRLPDVLRREADEPDER